MSGHHKWSEIKHKRDSIVWTGDNDKDVEEFANESDFGFIVGSNYHNFRWYHDVYNWFWVKTRLLSEWVPSDDTKVLEIYPERTLKNQPWHWTTARVGDRIYRDGTVERKQ